VKRSLGETAHFPLDIAGKLQAVLGHDTFLLTGAGDTILVDLPRWRLGLTTLRRSGGRAQREKALQRVHRALELADLTVHFRLRKRDVARLGARARPGLLSRALGVRPLEIRPIEMLAVITAWWR